MNKKQNPFGLVANDVVEIYFNSSRNGKGPFQASVTDLTDRTMEGNSGLIDYVRHGVRTSDPDYEDSCSMCFVTRVVSRFPRHEVPVEPTVNIFSEDLKWNRFRGDFLGYEKRSKGVYVGSLRNLTVIALASATGGGLDRPLSVNRLEELWSNSRSGGEISNPNPEHDDRLYVNWKVFKRWVIRNRNRLLMSQREMEECGKQYDKDMEKLFSEMDNTLAA